jgi:hypothetical protein
VDRESLGHQVSKKTDADADEGRSPPGHDHARRQGLNRRLRQEFLEGAEETSRRVLGRGLTEDKLLRILPRYPGDL